MKFLLKDIISIVSANGITLLAFVSFLKVDLGFGRVVRPELRSSLRLWLLAILGPCLMLFHHTGTPGVIYDQRGAGLAIATLFGGLPIGAIAMGLEILVRIGIGGAGWRAGVAGVVLDFAVCAAAIRLMSGPTFSARRPRLRVALIAAAVGATEAGSLLLIAPPEAGLRAFQDNGLALFLVQFISTGLFAWLLTHLIAWRAGEEARNALEFSEEVRRLGLAGAGIEFLLKVAADGRILDVNDAYVRRSGYSRAELLSMRIGDIRSFSGTGSFEEVAREIKASKQLRYESLHRRKDGSVFPVEVNIAYVPETDVFLSYFWDITERRASEAERSHLAAIVRSSRDAIISISPEGKVETWNPGAERMFGYARDEMVGRPIAIRAPPWQQREMKTHIANALDGRAPDTFRAVRLRKSGESFVASITVSPITGADGARTGVTAILSDVTERTRAEEALRRMTRALRTLSEANAVLIHETNRDELLGQTCRVIVEQGGYRMAWVGMAQNDLDKTVRPVAVNGDEDGYLENARISWADTERGRGPTGSAIRAGAVQVVRNFTADPQGRPWRRAALARGYLSSIALPLQARAATFGALTIYAPEPDAFDEEEVRLLTQMASNLSYGVEAIETRREREEARQAAEETRRNTQAELARFARIATLGQMVTTISHEINQPLTAIQTNSGAAMRWLAKDPPNVAEANAALRGIAENSGRANAIIQRLRAFHTRGDPKKIDFDLNLAVSEVLLLTEAERRAAKVVLRQDLPPDLPPARGDRVQVMQVVLNLVLNALEAIRSAPDGPRTLTVRTQCVDPANLLVQVEDTGVGLDAGAADRIFDYYYTTRIGGTGLGLAISRSIVEAHGGRIWASSAPGRGAIFQFTLPAARTEAPI